MAVNNSISLDEASYTKVWLTPFDMLIFHI
jgi:hypothetical protein